MKQDNSVGGSERVGYRVSGEDCLSNVSLWDNNVAHSCMIGVAMFPGDCEEQNRRCAKLNGFTVWRSGSFGIYQQVSINKKIHLQIISIPNY